MPTKFGASVAWITGVQPAGPTGSPAMAVPPPSREPTSTKRTTPARNEANCRRTIPAPTRLDASGLTKDPDRAADFVSVLGQVDLGYRRVVPL